MSDITIKRPIKKYDCLRSWRPYFIIFALGFLLYGRTLFFDYTYFDDSTLILDHAATLQDIRNIPQVFATDAFFSGDKFYYRPLLNLSFMIDAQAAGTLPFFFHLDNILLHCLAALLVFYFLNLFIGRRPLAFFLSLLFLVHPVMVQAAAWLPGRNDSLLAIFVLATFISFFKFCTAPKLRHYFCYLLFFLAALLTKESAVAIPVLAMFYLFFIKRDSAKNDKWLFALGSAVIGLIWFLMRRLALGGEPTNYFSALIGILHNSSALLVHIGKLVLPVNLSVLPILIDSTIIYGILAALLIAAAVFFSRQKRHNYLFFGTLWFLLFLLPSFIRLNTLPDFLEHRLYVPFIGLLIILTELDWIKNLDFGKKIVRAVAIFILAVLAVVSFWHSGAFSDRLTFWQAAAIDSPHSPLAQRNLGAMYYFNGDNEKAERYYQAALMLNPKEEMVHNNLGVIYMDQGDLKRAEAEFRTELQVNPGYDKALVNLYLLDLKKGLK